MSPVYHALASAAQARFQSIVTASAGHHPEMKNYSWQTIHVDLAPNQPHSSDRWMGPTSPFAPAGT